MNRTKTLALCLGAAVLFAAAALALPIPLPSSRPRSAPASAKAPSAGSSSSNPSSAAAPSVTGNGDWIATYVAGLKRARAEKRPVLLDFRADWCGPCVMMERETFSDPAVKALLKSFVLIRVDVDNEKDAAFAWRIEGIPRVIILNARGQVIGDLLGFRPPESFIPALKDAIAALDKPQPDGAPTAPALESEVALDAAEKQLDTADNDALTSAVTTLITIAKPEDRATGMAMLKPRADHVRPVLRGLLDDRRLSVRVGALECLKEIGSPVADYDPWASAATRREYLARLKLE